MKANIITLANHKGGVGKTTAAANIGASLASQGYNTLLVDLDAQANLTGTFTEESEQGRTIFHALTDGGELPVLQVKENLSLVPASVELANLETALANTEGRERRLSGLLAPLTGKYDFILIDTPPALSLNTISALCASSGVLIPLTAEGYSYKGLHTLCELIAEVKAEMNSDLSLLGIVLCRYEGRKVNRIVEEALRDTYEGDVFNTKIRTNVTLVEAPLVRQDIFSYNAKCRGAQDYLSLTQELLQKLGLSNHTSNNNNTNNTENK